MSESSEPAPIPGSCLCGAVRFEVHGRPPPVGMCHCSKCRKVSGTGSNAVLNIRQERLVWISGKDQLRSFTLPSGWGPTFCGVCSSPAPQLLDGRYLVPAGSLDVDPGPRVAGHIFVGSKASWDVIGDDGPQFDETP